MIAPDRNLSKYTKVIIVQQGGTAVDSVADINAAAKATFAKIGVTLMDVEQGTSEIGRPLDKHYTHFELPEGVAIPGDKLHQAKSFQATSGNNFKCYFTEDLLKDFALCPHCLLKKGYCIHSEEAKSNKRPAGSSSAGRQDTKRLLIAKYAGSSSTA